MTSALWLPKFVSEGAATITNFASRALGMAYSISSALAIYFVLWWVVLFVTLPFGVRSQSENGDPVPGSEHGAPVAPLMLKKIVWTTIISAVIFAVGSYGYRAGYLSVDRLTKLLGMPI